DISTASRNQIAQYKATERTSDLRIYDGRLHVLLRNGSADVVDVRNPKSPVKLTTYAGNDEPFALKVAGKYAAKKERNNVGVYQFEAY
ncbi:MAG: hypothetical protein HY897_26045, partial [Deltaproteobacteria bacterium]|nr:hypothetical protein [Deltaproteobacteria bacterium]